MPSPLVRSLPMLGLIALATFSPLLSPMAQILSLFALALLACTWIAVAGPKEPVRPSARKPIAMKSSIEEFVEKRTRDLLEASQRAEQANEAKSAFLAHMSHEIRTPMNGILGLVDLLLAGELHEDQRSYARLVREAGDSLLTIINDILDFSKIEAGRVELEERDFDLHDTLLQLTELLGVSAEEKGLQLSTDIRLREPAVVLGDSGRLRQVLINLIGNAIKFTPHGEVIVAVTEQDPGGEALRLLFEVKDSGPGIPEDQREKIFDEFGQARGETLSRAGGTGLGLTIARRLVMLMGGEIGVCSEVGAGSVFWFTLTLTPASSSTGSGSPGGEADPSDVPSALPARSHRPLLHEEEEERLEPRRTIRVLLAEDNGVNRMVARLQLVREGFEVDTAVDGEEVLHHLDAGRRYDVILMDCRMPELDGYQATVRIRESSDHYSDVPIIALTASALDADRQRCTEAGMDDFVSKPVDLQLLCRKIEEWSTRRSERLQSS